MHRIDNTTAVAQLPAPAPAGTPGYFTGGDLVGGVAPTIVDADWLNAIQEELISILAAGGITPNKTQKNQVLRALQAMFTSTGYVNSFGLGSHAANVPGNNIDNPTIPTGFYYVSATTSGTKPAGNGGYGHLIVSREGANGTTVRQLYMDNTSGRIWTRVRVPSQWSGWSEIAFLDSPAFTSATFSGSVGIGTSSPGSPFHVAKTNSAAPVGNGVHMGYETPNGNAWIQLNSVSGGTSYIDFSTDGTDYKGRVAYNLTSNILEFHANGAPYAYLTSLGDFLVGSLNTNFGHLALVGGSTNGGVGYIQVGHSSGVANGNWYLGFRYGNSVIGTITQASTSSVAYNTTSDRRLKDNIVPAPDAGPVIDGIEVVSHDWKLGGHTRFGVIAQDLHTVYPEAVTPGDDSDGGQVERPWSVDYSKLVPLMIREIQSLRARVAALEAKEGVNK